MKRWAALLALGGLAVAQNPGPFEPPPANAFRTGVAVGARARWAEALAHWRGRLDAAPGDADAIGAAFDALARFGREAELLARAEKAADAAPEARAADVDLVVARCLIAKAQEGAGGMGWIIRNNRVVVRPNQLTAAGKARMERARTILRVLWRKQPENPVLMDLLADTIEWLSPPEDTEEEQRLRTAAEALRARAARAAVPADIQLDQRARILRAQAERLEQAAAPDHARAAQLRKRALVLEFCTHTVPFTEEPAVYGAVSLLAPADLVRRNLTRTYAAVDGEVRTVAPQYYAPSARRQQELIEALALDTTDAGTAALLALLRGVRSSSGYADLVIASLSQGERGALRALPALLDAALASGDAARFPRFGRRELVRAAVALGRRDAAPVLAKHLAADRDLDCPLELAAALAELGGPEHADALLRVAKDRGAAPHFRRSAVFALGKLAPERLAEAPSEPVLEIAIAAARCRTAPSEADQGRVLAGIGRPHEVDDAARYARELDLRAAVPLLQDFAEREPDHYATPQVLAELRRWSRD